ncbi:hypothetical protein A7982_13933 [Minicystis rosea]|nr:hypothetical protein A7982_13933 [Minicystis rosea]
MKADRRTTHGERGLLRRCTKRKGHAVVTARGRDFTRDQRRGSLGLEGCSDPWVVARSFELQRASWLTCERRRVGLGNRCQPAGNWLPTEAPSSETGPKSRGFRVASGLLKPMSGGSWCCPRALSARSQSPRLDPWNASPCVSRSSRSWRCSPRAAAARRLRLAPSRMRGRTPPMLPLTPAPARARVVTWARAVTWAWAVARKVARTRARSPMVE